MEEIKAPKKERKFLKAVGNIAKFLANELVMGIARKFIGKAIDNVGNKRQGLSIVLIILASSFAFAQFPNTVTATPTSLLGKDGSNVVGNVTLGSSLTLSSGTLNVTATGTFTTTNSDYTIVSTDKYIAFNNNFSNITVTLPSASDNTGRELHFRNVAAGSIISASNNVINDTVTTGTPDNSILGAGNTNYKWCTLVSNGTYWIKMQAN